MTDADQSNLKTIFGLSDEELKSLISIATFLCNGNREELHESLQRIATFRSLLIRNKLNNPREMEQRRQETVNRAKRISALCDKLSDEIDALDPITGGALLHLIDSPENEKGRPADRSAGDLLFKISQCAQRIANEPVKFAPPNVDKMRDMVWMKLIEKFEASQSCRARVSIAAEGNSAGRQPGAAYGSIHELIRDFMATVPGAKVPTAHEVRGVERKCRDQRQTMASTTH